jgi:hypothetical protein
MEPHPRCCSQVKPQWTWESLSNEYFDVEGLSERGAEDAAAWMESVYLDMGQQVLRNGSSAPPDFFEAVVHAYNFTGLPISKKRTRASEVRENQGGRTGREAMEGCLSMQASMQQQTYE